jgi:acetyltransferase
MTYQIHRYPAELIDVVVLRGRRVVIRPILPQDEDITDAFFSSLSSEARRDRFLSPARTLPPGLLERLTHVDYSGHVALVAEVFVDGRETVIAEARFVRLEDGASAEFAVSVAESWQRLGLASLMLAKLVARAASAGITRMVGETLATNDRMLHLARKAGFAIRPTPGARGVLHLEKELDQVSAGLDGTVGGDMISPAA